MASLRTEAKEDALLEAPNSTKTLRNAVFAVDLLNHVEPSFLANTRAGQSHDHHEQVIWRRNKSGTGGLDQSRLDESSERLCEDLGC